MSETILSIENLVLDYNIEKNNRCNHTRAIDNFSLNIYDGEIFAIAGESGCGKSSLLKTIIKLIQPTSGNILYKGKSLLNTNRTETKDLIKNIQMIFQNPYASLNPKMKIKEILAEPLLINKRLSKVEIKEKVLQNITKVGLSEEHLERYPHEFSGGQRQRIAIARALMLEPKLILADEPVSALDASIQAQIINLINELKQQYNMTVLFISHDLNVIKYIADRIGIMYLGQLVEIGTKEEIFNNPQHPYTKLLLKSVPNINNKNKNISFNELNIDSNSGCKFYNRCNNSNCKNKDTMPKYRTLSDTHKVLCPYND